MNRVDAGGENLDAGINGARRLLEVGGRVVVQHVVHVIDQAQIPGVLGVDLVLGRHLDASRVQVRQLVVGQRRTAGACTG